MLQMNPLSKKLHLKTAFIFVVLFCVVTEVINSQTTKLKADSLINLNLRETVFTANRYENSIFYAGASATSLTDRFINMLPVQRFSGILKYIPGVFPASPDGMGLEPKLIVRGFFGGGEAEYLTVMVDGIPLNDLESGIVRWDLVPLYQLAGVELLRGGASALYGDAALGGVLNMITKIPEKRITNIDVGYGRYNTYNFGFRHAENFKNLSFDFFINNEGTDGFRDHSKWNSLTFGGKMKLVTGRNSYLFIRSFNQILKKDIPGPLDQKLMALNRRKSASYYSEDGTNYNKYIVNADFRQRVNNETDLSISFTWQHKDDDVLSTMIQPPLIVNPFTFSQIGVYDTSAYGDSKRRLLETDQGLLAVRLMHTDSVIGYKLTGGVEADLGFFNSITNDVFQGFEFDYENHFTKNQILNFTGDGSRMKSSAYLCGEIRIITDLKFLSALRYDFISDYFKSNFPVADTSLGKSYHAFSPRLGLNLLTGDNENYKGNIFASYSRAYKMPSIDQLTDMKTVNYATFFPAGPVYQMMINKGNPFSNAELKPQKSNNFEIGIYQFFRVNKCFSVLLNFTGYHTDVEDEIDFDLVEYRYRNIQSSRHSGIEASVNFNYGKNWTGFMNLQRCEVKFTSGENDGNYLKGVPKLSQALGVSYAPQSGFGAGLTLHGASGIYLDDKNTSKLDSYNIFGVKLFYSFDFVNFSIDLDNIFNTDYSNAGYLLFDSKQIYPAMGFFVRGGVNFNF